MIPYKMTKISTDQYKSFVQQKELSMINMHDRTKKLRIYLELCKFQINHIYILPELPYYYIRSLYDWVNSSMIYVEHCLSIETSNACHRLLLVQSQVIELFSEIIEITSSDYDDLQELNVILLSLKAYLEGLHPSLITCPNTRNNIHIAFLTLVLNNITSHNI
jgi:hypothetical protein